MKKKEFKFFRLRNILKKIDIIVLNKYKHKKNP